ncbi:tripartite tricarboxylate transporter substrate binding protein [bacterium LRH843]|nr:tripartite tricarboxylate transporter substrate binding protein [bacterium LRH843]
MMKKNILYLFFVLLLSLGLVGCGSNATNSTKDAGNGAKPEAKEETKEEAGGGEAAAVDYPTRDIQIFVGHGAGGGTDNFTRQIARLMEQDLGVNINVVNMEGAGGVIAKKNGANEPADGYTIVASSALAIQVAMGTNTDAHLNVYKPIARVQSDTTAIQVKSGTFDGIDDFIEKAKANPGQLKIGGTGVGTVDDVVVSMFKKELGLDIIFVPFEGAGQMHAALLGGHIDAMSEEPGPTISSIEAGEIDPILFFTEKTIAEFPDVPVSVERGWNITNGVERGLLIHKDTPQEIIDILEQSVKKAYDSDEYKEYEKNSYLHLREGWLGSDDYYEKLKNDIDVFTEILSANAK